MHAWRYRAGARNRIESFSDSVFGFSITLLVVSTSVPHTFGDLVATMKGFVGFALCFLSLFTVWQEHRNFYRRYDLQDATTLWLNSLLLFLVIFYVHPLKFLFMILAQQMANIPIAESVITNADVPLLMIIFAAGFGAVNLVMAAMYTHAKRLRTQLELSPFEVVQTQQSINACWLNVLVAAASALLAALNATAAAGLIYMSLAVLQSANGWWMRKKSERV